MKHRIKVTSGNGHESNNLEDPDFVEFDTEEEAAAFILGVNMASEALDGWVDAWIMAERLTTIRLAKEEK